MPTNIAMKIAFLDACDARQLSSCSHEYAVKAGERCLACTIDEAVAQLIQLQEETSITLFKKGVEHGNRLYSMQHKIDRRTAVIEAFLKKWEEAVPHINAPIMLQAARSGGRVQYTGPSLGPELEALKEVIK